MSKYREVQNRLNQILERADVGDRVSRSIDLFLTALVIINIISITLESVPQFYAAYKLLFIWIEIISVGIFTVEYLCRVWVAPSKVPGQYSFAVACKARAKYMLSFSATNVYRVLCDQTVTNKRASVSRRLSTTNVSTTVRTRRV